jgi:hypothetical protein
MVGTAGAAAGTRGGLLWLPATHAFENKRAAALRAAAGACPPVHRERPHRAGPPPPPPPRCCCCWPSVRSQRKPRPADDAQRMQPPASAAAAGARRPARRAARSLCKVHTPHPRPARASLARRHQGGSRKCGCRAAGAGGRAELWGCACRGCALAVSRMRPRRPRPGWRRLLGRAAAGSRAAGAQHRQRLGPAEAAGPSKVRFGHARMTAEPPAQPSPTQSTHAREQVVAGTYARQAVDAARRIAGHVDGAGVSPGARLYFPQQGKTARCHCSSAAGAQRRCGCVRRDAAGRRGVRPGLPRGTDLCYTCITIVRRLGADWAAGEVLPASERRFYLGVRAQHTCNGAIRTPVRGARHSIMPFNRRGLWRSDVRAALLLSSC